ncbi:TadE/TadG family type IV pilus assembly protein [uncultured Sneathiella sp.]|uniref:TadE/TadG family type IV pilus assembly protein n=1 Tax=uncultured Sneathiella sp. TaxID=879315 RepID=UPI0030DCFFA1|tara:strand:- start:1560 stop:2879 length:1320 start_codon:yes stop_codon:yes gene_type:complete
MTGRAFLSRFTRSEDGAALLIFTLTLFIVLGGIAFAIDASRFFSAKSRLSLATEMAAVAAAKNLRFLDTSALEQMTADVMRANFEGASLLSYESDSAVSPTVAVTPNLETGDVTVESSATVPTTLLRALNFMDDVTVSARITARQEMPEAEVALVLEASDSMEASGRLAEVRTAASAFISAMEAEVPQGAGVKWGFVPFGNVLVNVAPHSDWVESGSWPLSLPPLIPGTTGWTGPLAEDRWCVSPRNSGAGEDDIPPNVTPFPLILSLSSEIDMLTGLPHFTNVTTADCREERILPLGDGATLLDALSGLIGNGDAAYGRGMLWAERLLSPQWQGVWTGDSTIPAAYDDAIIEKVALLLTSSAASDISENTRLADTCTRIKGNGIHLYTIDYLAPATTSILLQGCASTAGHYFRVTDAAGLNRAFLSIARFLTIVRFPG